MKRFSFGFGVLVRYFHMESGVLHRILIQISGAWCLGVRSRCRRTHNIYGIANFLDMFTSKKARECDFQDKNTCRVLRDRKELLRTQRKAFKNLPALKNVSMEIWTCIPSPQMTTGGNSSHYPLIEIRCPHEQTAKGFVWSIDSSSYNMDFNICDPKKTYGGIPGF